MYEFSRTRDAIHQFFTMLLPRPKKSPDNNRIPVSIENLKTKIMFGRTHPQCCLLSCFVSFWKINYTQNTSVEREREPVAKTLQLH